MLPGQITGPGGDAAIVRVKETGSSIAISLDGNARYCYLSPREGVMLNVAECCRNLSVVGALGEPGDDGVSPFPADREAKLLAELT